MPRSVPPNSSVPAKLLLFLVLLSIAIPAMLAQESTDLDAHTVRLSGFWFYSQPYGSFHGSGNQGGFDFHADAEFGYSLGSRLNIKSTNNRIGLDLTQRGAVAGLERCPFRNF